MRLGMKREARQVCSAFGLDKEFYSEVFLLLPGLVVGNGTGVVFQGQLTGHPAQLARRKKGDSSAESRG